jgi:hypothetical protein
MALNYSVGQITVQKQSTKKERLRLQFAKENIVRISKNKREHLFPLGCNLSKKERERCFSVRKNVGFSLGCNLSKKERERCFSVRKNVAFSLGCNRKGARGRAHPLKSEQE